MSRIGIYLPTYHRPESLQKVYQNIVETTFNPIAIFFGVELEDEASQKAVHKLGVMAHLVVNLFEPGYSNTIQSIYEQDKYSEFFIHANDDFEFTQGWDIGPIDMFMDQPKLMVVGLRQREQDRDGSAICMVRKSYIKDQSGVIDVPNRVFYPYNHNYQDTEFTQTAQSRGVWAKYDPLVIHHRHPGFINAEKDEVYKKNDATAEVDQRTFEKRRHLWT